MPTDEFSSIFTTHIEPVLREVILKDLAKGRKDFDLPHTEAVVYWMKWLTEHVASADAFSPKVLITAAYAHDWGYIGLFDGVDSNDPAVIKERKPLHMQRGAELITELLQKRLSDHFSAEEIAQVADLVRIHDEVEKLKTESEILIMEADTLGMLDVDRVKPTFTPEENQKFIEKEVYGRRLLHFVHPQALTVAKEFAEKRLSFTSQK